MEQSANSILLVGNMASAPIFSHINHGRRFSSFALEVERLSGTLDRLNILARQELLERTILTDGCNLRITGQIRSYNNRSPGKPRLIISVLAETIELCDDPHDNQVHLSGVICKEPVYRRTPLGREICDVMLAVNRLYHRADYLPCILWGQHAQEAAYYPVGTPLELTGRLQSRNYTKLIDNIPTQRTAFEISAITAEIPEAME